jgi:hypothetical protein
MIHLTRLHADPRFSVAPDGTNTDLIAKDLDAKLLLPKLTVATPTGDVSLRQYGIDMDQLSEGACAGNSTAESVEVLNNIAGYKAIPLSRQFIYNMARQETGDLANDNGTYIRICFDVLSRFGVCDEYIFPYDPASVHLSPTLMAMRQALGHKISAAYRINDVGQARLDAVITALRANHPVVFGTQVSNDYSNVSDATPQKPPTSNIEGGHAQVIMGFIGGNFLIKNSWGTGWGDGGYAYFDPSYITWDQTQDLWVPTLGLDMT